MMHTIKLIKEFYPKYKYHKILIVSPCTAKKRELAELGKGDFNVTLTSFLDYLKFRYKSICRRHSTSSKCFRRIK